MARSFKLKYHGDLERSKKYAAREEKAIKLLSRLFRNTNITVRTCGIGVNTIGVVRGRSSGLLDLRFDLALTVDGIDICFIEVTGDMLRDKWARILSEKVWKAKELTPTVFFMYNKAAFEANSRKLLRNPAWRVFHINKVVRLVNENKAQVKKWLRNEKDYIFIPFKEGMTLGEFRQYVLYLLPMFIG